MSEHRLDYSAGNAGGSRSVRRYAETLEVKPSFRSRMVRHRHFPTVMLLLLVIVLICLHIWQRVFAIELANQVVTLRTAQQGYTDALKKQTSEIVALSTPTRIQTFAKDSLGMLPVAADRLFTVVTSTEQDRTVETPMTQMFAAFKRLGDYLPTSTEALAEPRDLIGVTFDTISNPTDNGK
jgi:cell division protein FtsL